MTLCSPQPCDAAIASRFSLALLFAGLAVINLASLAAAASSPPLIPRPAHLIEADGRFVITSQTQIVIDQAPAVHEVAEFLANLLAAPLGKAPRIVEAAGDGSAPHGILLTRAGADAALGDEGYELTVAPASIVIRAPQPAGLFYGVQTLRQLLPPAVERRSAVTGVEWAAPCVTIKDAPRYAWRGFMLDVSRHFLDKSEVERFLDAMALQKLNVFHWHLTDDQGWRIEIKKYPKLTQVGAWRAGIGFGLNPADTSHYDKAGRYGGFYTQDDIREVVAYATRLHITIVPEIEMPGHSVAALAAYPQFSCGKQPVQVPTDGGIKAGIYCAGDDEVFAFFQDVLTEVMALFPGSYIHIGGDEVPKGNWHNCQACQARMKAEGLKNEEELQSYFVRRIEKFVSSRHRHLIGWDEILEGGIAPGAAVMSWRGIGGGIAAAREGHDVVMSPTSNAYFDFYQSHDPGTPRAIGGFLPLETVYRFEPTPAELTPEQAKHILGAQANLWGEFIPSASHAQYMTFPRCFAMAEVTWSAKDCRDYPDFLVRLPFLVTRLKEMNIRCYESAPR